MENLQATINDLDMFGLGISHRDDKVIFIDNSLPGEIVEYEKTKTKKNLVFAKNLKIIKKCENRVTPLCPYFNECGGCDIQHLKYLESLNFKKEQIKTTFKKIANINLEDFEIIKSDNEYFYRNKIALQINKNKKLCMHKKNSNDLIEIESCKLISPKFDYVIKCVNAYLNHINLTPYDKTKEEGDLKHLVVKIINDNLLLTFVLKRNSELEDINFLYNNLKQKFKNVGINKNINKFDHEILSQNFINLIGLNTINYSSFNIIQKINNASFLQVNEGVATKLYNYVLQNVKKNIVNAYSGAGLLSGILSKNLKSKVYGIEINPNSHKLANILKQENNLTNLENFCGDARKILKQLNLKNFTLILDPPRSGLDKNMIDEIIQNLPDKIIYISCNKITMAKNLKELLRFYDLGEIKAFDMFPQTVNCEVAAILEKK